VFINLGKNWRINWTAASLEHFEVGRQRTPDVCTFSLAQYCWQRPISENRFHWLCKDFWQRQSQYTSDLADRVWFAWLHWIFSILVDQQQHVLIKGVFSELHLNWLDCSYLRRFTVVILIDSVMSVFLNNRLVDDTCSLKYLNKKSLTEECSNLLKNLLLYK